MTQCIHPVTNELGRDDWALKLPRNLARFENENFKEVRLVYNKSRRRYYWHVVIEDGRQPGKPTGNGIAGIDLGEIHPAAITDGTNGLVISCREMRATMQYPNKRLATLKRLQSSKQKYSRRWWRIQRRSNRFLAQQASRTRDMEHPVTAYCRACRVRPSLVDWTRYRRSAFGTVQHRDAHHVQSVRDWVLTQCVQHWAASVSATGCGTVQHRDARQVRMRWVMIIPRSPRL